MPIPYLMHAIPIGLKLIRKDQTLMDDDAREPIGNVYRNTVVSVQGQVYWQDQTFEASREGDIETTLGYILFLRRELDASNITIQKGDEIVSMGQDGIGGGDLKVEKPLFIYRFRFRGHHPDQGGATLLKAWFTDKDPVKKR